MEQYDRGRLIGTLWFFVAATMIALFIMAAIQGELSFGHVVIVLAVLGLAVAGTLYISNHPIFDDATKPKRNDVDGLLAHLTEDDLAELRYRLRQTEATQRDVLDYVGDDGELQFRRDSL